MFTLRPNAFYYFGNIWVQISSNYKRGCCIRSPLVTKHFEVVLLDENITQLVRKMLQSTVNLIVKVYVIIIYNIKSATGIC